MVKPKGKGGRRSLFSQLNLVFYILSKLQVDIYRFFEFKIIFEIKSLQVKGEHWFFIAG